MMPESNEPVRMILKFDTGADGFLKMIYVLAAMAVLVLIIGIVFIWQIYHSLSH